MMRDTSLEAYASIQPLNSRQKAVLELLEASQEPLTNKAMAERLGWEINTVTPRTGELVSYGLVHDAGSRRDPKTHRMAHTWKAGKKIEPPKMEYKEVEIDGVRMMRLVPKNNN